MMTFVCIFVFQILVMNVRMSHVTYNQCGKFSEDNYSKGYFCCLGSSIERD